MEGEAVALFCPPLGVFGPNFQTIRKVYIPYEFGQRGHIFF